LTEDDNVASLLDQRVERGETTQIAAASAPNREALTGYLGSPDPPQPDIRKDGLLLQPGDRVIGCSDGLYRGLSSKAMAEASYHKDPMSAAEQLVDTVLRQRLPHQDNLTVVLFELSPYFRFAWFFRVVSELFSLTGLGRAPGPVMSGGLWGAVGGFAAAMAFAALLHWFGVWDFSSAEQDAVGDVPLDQTSPVNPVKSPTPQDEPPSFPEPVPKPTPPEEGRQDQPSESGIEEQDAPARAKAEGTP
jgi:hypothetical protein